MDFLSIFLIAVGLGMDALSVAVATGAVLGRPSGAAVFRMSFAFGFFSSPCPWPAGRQAGRSRVS